MSLLHGVSRMLVLPSPVTWILTREASKKAGTSSKNLGGKSPGRRYGYKKLDGSSESAGRWIEAAVAVLCDRDSELPLYKNGEFVHAGNILATQRLMRWHPGSQVGIGRNNTLFALEDGVVRYTKEVYIPPPRSSDSINVVTKLPYGAVLYKTFINVIPKPKEHSFKLVDML